MKGLIHGGLADAPERIRLLDDERKRIRASSTKRGYTAVFEFQRGARGGRFRTERTTALPTRGQCDSELAECRAAFRTPVAKVTVFEVDHMDRVQNVEAVA